MAKKKLNNPKLVKVVIINKKGNKQTVWVRPDEAKKLQAESRTFVHPVTRPIGQESVSVNRKTLEVYHNTDTLEGIKERFKNKPVALKVMTEGKWITTKDGKRIKLSQKEWKDLFKELEGQIKFVARKYAFGQSYGDRYEELFSVGSAAMVDAVNKYAKVFNPKKPFNLRNFVHVYVHGRIKEAVANRLDAGLRIPKFLRKPYQEFVKVKGDLAGKMGHKPSREAIAKELNKVWNKQTFYPQYRLADARTYGELFIVKTAKGTVVYKGTDEGKARLIAQKKKLSFEKTVRSFKDLPPAQQAEEKKLDLLPMQGYISISKTGVAAGKDEKHEENKEKITEDFRKKREELEASYLLGKGKSKKDKIEGKRITSMLQKKVEDLDAEIEKLKKQKVDALVLVDAEEVSAKDEVKNFPPIEKPGYSLKSKEGLVGKDRLERIKKQTELDALRKKLKTVSSDAYRDKMVKDINIKIKELGLRRDAAQKDYEVGKLFYEPMNEEKYKKRLEQLEQDEKTKFEDEVHRYNKDASSTMIPGMIQRIKEFEQIETIKEHPLDLYVNSDEGDSRSNLEVTVTPDQMNEEERQVLLVQHSFGKQYLKDSIRYLIPAYRDIMALRMGLHERSESTVDNLWGQLSTTEEIVKFLDKKHKILLSSPDKFIGLVKTIKDPLDQEVMLRSVPYITDTYFSNPRQALTDYTTWKKAQPIAGGERKIKIKPEVYKKLYKKYKQAKIQARKEWRVWRKKNRGVTQEQSTKAYTGIKKKLRATGEYKPKRFINVKVKKVDPKRLQIWESKKPKIFYESFSGKERYVNNAVRDSGEILRNIVPIRIVRDLLDAHRKFVESGVTITSKEEEKAEQRRMVQDFFRKKGFKI